MTKYMIPFVLVATLGLQGCAAVFLGSAAVATKTATDPRSVGTQIDDTTLDSRTSIALKKDEYIKTTARIITTSYQGRVLLTGQATSQELIDRAQELVAGVDGVEKVYNEIRLGTKVGLGTISNDAWITAKVRSQLLGYKDIKSRNMKVVTENGEVFLMGFSSQGDSDRAARVASQVAGVKMVIKVFNYAE